MEEHQLVLYLLHCFDTAGDYISSDSDTMVCPLFRYPLGDHASSDWNYARYGLDVSQMGLVSRLLILLLMCCVVDKHALLIVEVVLSSVLVLLWMAFGHFGCADGEFRERKELGFFVERTEG